MAGGQLTLQNIIGYFASIAAQHDQIESFYYGPKWDVNVGKYILKNGKESNTAVYPIMIVIPNDFKATPESVVISHNIEIIDQIQADVSNRVELLSDNLQTLLDIKAFIWKDFSVLGENIFPDKESKITPYYENYDDNLCGWSMDLDLQIDWLRDVCTIPGLYPSGVTFNGTNGFYSVNLVGYVPIAGNVAMTGPLTGTTFYANDYYSGGTELITVIESLITGSTTPNVSPWSASTGASSAVLTGSTSIASGNFAVAEGNSNTASGFYSHAEGYQTSATTNYTHAEGNATLANNIAAHAEGDNTTSSSVGSHSEGITTKATNFAAHAEGAGTTAAGQYSHAEGQSTTAIGTNSHSEGYFTTANGAQSHAEGQTTLAHGNSSHSEGYGTQAAGDYSHSENLFTTASGIASHAEGSGTTANGNYSHAEGSGTTATGQASHAGGIGSFASGNTSFVHGSGSTAGGSHTIVLGANITGTTNNMTYVEQLNINRVPNTTIVLGLGLDANNNVVTGSTGSIFTGGTVTGATYFSGGLSATTISATTYLNLPPLVSISGNTVFANTNGSSGPAFTGLSYASTFGNFNNLVSRDSNGNSHTNNFESATIGLAAVGTYQYSGGTARISVYTNGSGSATAILPDATTLQVGHVFEFNNNATGIITISANTGSVLTTVPAGGYVQVILLTNSFTSGTWDYHFLLPSNVQFGTSGLTLGNTINVGTLSATNATITNEVVTNMTATTITATSISATTQVAGDDSNNVATTAFVYNAINGLNPAVSVQVASTANITGLTYNNGTAGVGATLSAATITGITVDGYTMNIGDAILFKNQTSAATNGIYVLTTGGTTPCLFTRRSDYNTPSNINNTGLIPVINGTTNGGTSWQLITTVVSVGTSVLNYKQFTTNATTYNYGLLYLVNN